VDALLAPLAPGLYQRQRHDRRLTPEAFGDGLSGLADRILTDPER
jgi:hypothetical protein